MDRLIEERYFGQLPEFKEMEYYLQRIIDKIKADPKHSNPNKFPENEKLQNLMKKVFGVKRSIFYWEPFNIENAYTVACNVLLLIGDSGKYLQKRETTGFYDESHKMVLTIYLYPGVITVSKLTARELLAVILHETGHNFDKSGYHLFSLIINSFLTFGMNILGTLAYKNKENKLKLDYYKQVKKEDDPIFDDTKKRDEINNILMKQYKDYYKGLTWRTVLSLPLNIMALPVLAFACPFIQIGGLSSKAGEVFADSFATAYGYGTELVSALEKFNNTEKYYKPKTPLQIFMNDLGMFQAEVYRAFFECHGSNQDRCKNCINKLKADLKKNDFPPELREELINEINRISAQYKQLISFDEHERYKLTKIWRKINHYLFGGIPHIYRFLKKHRV